MKYLLVIADGMADEACAALGGLTPLAFLHHPVLDAFAASGAVGVVQTVPDGCEIASETAIPAILGYDPASPGRGRGVYEAAGLGVELTPGQIALRVNISDDAAGRWDISRLAELTEERPDVRFYPLGKMKFLMTLDGGSCLVDCPAPYKKATEPSARAIAPQGEPTAELLNGIISRSGGEVMPWGPSEVCRLKPFSEIHPQLGRGAVISGVPLVRGIGRLAGMDVMSVAGATGGCDTDYDAKTCAALSALDSHDFVLLHIEAPDEASHRKDVDAKLKAISAIADRVVRRLVNELSGLDVKVAFMPDHATSVTTGMHLAGPVPFILWGNGVGHSSGIRHFDECLCGRLPVQPCRGFLDTIFCGVRQKGL